MLRVLTALSGLDPEAPVLGGADDARRSSPRCKNRRGMMASDLGTNE
jgi:hypothetical protein